MRNLRMNGMNSKGQALVEMAIIIPLLLFLVLGILEFGRFMYTKNSLTNAARAGARAAVVTYNISNGSEKVNNSCTYSSGTSNDAVFSATCKSLTSGLRDKNIYMTLTVPSTPPTSGEMINLKVQWNSYTTAVPKFFPQLNTIPMYGETAMRYE